MSKIITTARQVAAGAACGLFLTACGPSYFMTTPPSKHSKLRTSSYARSKRAADSVAVRLGFVGYQNQELVFEVDIRNESSRSVLVAPETFYYLPMATTSVVSAAPAATFPPRVAAVDSELRLEQLATRLAEESELATKVSLWELFTTVSNLAENAANSKKKETELQAQAREQRHRNEKAYFNEQREQHAVLADKLYEQKQGFEYHLLRKTTLEPDQRVRGHVYFPRTDAASLLRIVTFPGEHPITFDFTQKIDVQRDQSASLAAESK